MVELQLYRVASGREAVIEHLAGREAPPAQRRGIDPRHRRRVDLRHARRFVDDQLDRAVGADRQVPAGPDPPDRLDDRQHVRRREVIQRHKVTFSYMQSLTRY